VEILIILLIGVGGYWIVKEIIKPVERPIDNKQTSSFKQYGLMKPGEKLLDIDLHEWSGLWWRWAYTFSENRNPVADMTGKLSYLGEQDDIWYLAGSFSSNPVYRKATVKVGKPIFFPIINELYEVAPHVPCRQAVANLVESFNPKNLFVEIDGVALTNVAQHKIVTPTCFDLIPRQNSPVVSIGYWVALASLPVGEYKLSFGGENGYFKQNITYQLNVVH